MVRKCALYKPDLRGPARDVNNKSLLGSSYSSNFTNTTHSSLRKSTQKNMASKTIIVTGAGRGIGLAASQYLLQRSHKVVLVARTESELKALKDQYPSQVEYLAADLADFDVRTHDNIRLSTEKY